MATSASSISIKKSPQPTHSSLSAPKLSELASSPTSLTTKASQTIKKQPANRSKITENNTNRARPQNGEEWTEISLNNSPDEIYYNNDVYSDDEDQIPYKPLPSDLSPEPALLTNVPGDVFPEKKRLNHQQSLPVMLETNEMTFEDLKRTESTQSPTVKCRGKLDSSLANWISRSSCGNSGESSSGISGELKKFFLKLYIVFTNL